MKVFLSDAAGAEWELPPLLRWEVSHALCSPCDALEATVVFRQELLPVLRGAVRVRAEHGEETVFVGTVDEAEVTADARGCLATVRCRGNQALLLDSEAEAADYYRADTDFILNRHARALGVTDIDARGCAGKRATFSVDSGESHWSVVRRFAEFCLGVTPRFSPAGTLILDGAESGRTLTVDAKTALSAQTFAQERCGVIGSAVVKNRVFRTQVTVTNQSLDEFGGGGRRVINVPRRTSFDAMRHTGAYQIRRSGRDFLRCRLTLPQLFAAFPGDRVLLEETPIGVDGDWYVSASRCFADGTDSGTSLDLRQRYEPILK